MIVDPEAERLADAFWPGPLTLILKRLPQACEAACGGQDTIGLRAPAHPVSIQLLEAFMARGKTRPLEPTKVGWPRPSTQAMPSPLRPVISNTCATPCAAHRSPGSRRIASRPASSASV